MGGMFFFLPKVKRCCFCTRNLKVACVLIDVWTMFATCQEIKMLLWPACETQYESSSEKMNNTITVFKWIFFAVNLLLLASTFAYLFGIFMYIPITADIFICCGIASFVVSLIFVVLIVIQMVFTKCVNPTDVMSFILFLICSSYFIIIVNSYRDDM